MSPLLYVFRYLLANQLTSFYNTVVRTTYLLEDINNPPNATVPVPLRLQANCIEPKYGVHKYLNVNGVDIHCVVSGNKSLPLMLLVHGFPEFWYSWRYQILHYQTRYRVVAVDLRGFGDSDKPLSIEQYTINYLVDDLKGVIEQLGYKKAIFLCHDWGGVICFSFRETYPSYMTALMALSSTSLNAWFHEIWNNPNQSKGSGYMTLYRSLIIPEMRLERNNMTILDKFLITPGKTTVTKDDVECYKFWFGQPHGFTYPVNLYRANFQFTYSKKKYTDGIPSVCALGSKEVALTPNILTFMNSTYEPFEYARIEDVGHFMQQQDPDIVNNFTDYFLKKHSL